MANEVHDVSALFYRRLTADAPMTALVATRVYEEFAASGATYPMVLITFLAATDVNAVGADQRIFTRPLFLVEAITTETNWVTADQIADRFDQLLTGYAGTFGNTVIEGIYRERPMRRVEITLEGKRLNHLGGQYRVWCTGG